MSSKDQGERGEGGEKKKTAFDSLYLYCVDGIPNLRGNNLRAKDKCTSKLVGSNEKILLLLRTNYSSTLGNIFS